MNEMKHVRELVGKFRQISDEWYQNGLSNEEINSAKAITCYAKAAAYAEAASELNIQIVEDIKEERARHKVELNRKYGLGYSE